MLTNNKAGNEQKGGGGDGQIGSWYHIMTLYILLDLYVSIKKINFKSGELEYEYCNGGFE